MKYEPNQAKGMGYTCMIWERNFFLHNTAVTLTLLLENLVHGHCITFTQKHSAGEVWARLVKEIENLLQTSDVEWTDSQLI